LDKVPISGQIDTATNTLVFTNSDGTTTSVDIAALITQYEFDNSATITFTITGGKVVANIPDGAITDAKLQSGYLAAITLQAQSATQQAALAKRYAVGGVEEGDTIDNAKYYKEQAAAAAAAAEAIAGFDPMSKIDVTEKGVAGGVATLNESGKLPIEQIPNEIGTGDMSASVYDPQGKVQDIFAYAEGLFAGVTSFSVQVVSALPTENIDIHTIYFVPKSAEPYDNYDEYMYLNSTWEHIGSTTVDLSGYIPKTDIVDNLTTNDATKPLSAAQGKVINDNLAYVTESLVNTYIEGATVSKHGTTKFIRMWNPIKSALSAGTTYTFHTIQDIKLLPTATFVKTILLTNTGIIATLQITSSGQINLIPQTAISSGIVIFVNEAFY
jgi:hypothetical protein